MEINSGVRTVHYYDLDEDLLDELDQVENESLPQGQTFVVQDGHVLGIENNLWDLFEQVNETESYLVILFE